MSMGNAQIRFPDEMEKELDELADELQTSRSEVVRRAVADALPRIRINRALEDYAEGDRTLSSAAAYAKVSVPKLVHEAARRGLTVVRQSPEELDQDIEAIETFLDRDQGPGAG